MTHWYYATKDTPPPTAIRLIAYDAEGRVLGRTTEGVATHGLNQTRSNCIGSLLRTFGDRLERYEEWHTNDE